MAKLTDIPVVTSLDDADLIYAVDVSDTTDDPAGSSVAITKANFGGGLPAGTVVKEEIDRITDPGTGQFDFAIPSGYDRILIEGKVDSSGAVGDDKVFCYLNSLTSNNYFSTRFYGAPTNAVAESSAVPHLWYVGGTTNTGVSVVSAQLEGPDDSFGKKVTGTFAYDYSGGTLELLGSGVIRTDNTAAVTALSLVAETGPLTGTLILYGERTL